MNFDEIDFVPKLGDPIIVSLEGESTFSQALPAKSIRVGLQASLKTTTTAGTRLRLVINTEDTFTPTESNTPFEFSDGGNDVISGLRASSTYYLHGVLVDSDGNAVSGGARDTVLVQPWLSEE